MSMDAKWYANWVRLLPASTADEKMRNLEAADMVEELDKRVPRWISVDERLPEPYKHVLVATRFTDEGDPDFEIAYLGMGSWRKPDGMLFGVVTHWMPLPEPPEEGGE